MKGGGWTNNTPGKVKEKWFSADLLKIECPYNNFFYIFFNTSEWTTSYSKSGIIHPFLITKNVTAVCFQFPDYKNTVVHQNVEMYDLLGMKAM